MTEKEILKDIIEKYSTRLKDELEIAEDYFVDNKDISDLLQECGYRNTKIENVNFFKSDNSPDIEKMWQNPKVQRICKKIRQSSK